MTVQFRLPAASKATLAILLGAALVSCGGEGNSAPGTSVNNPAPAPAPTPSQYVSTPVPFGLTADQTFDVLGLDDWPANPVNSQINLRWNNASKTYEIQRGGSATWNVLRQLVGGTNEFDVVDPGGALAPYQVWLLARNPASLFGRYTGEARLFDGTTDLAYIAFGIGTAAGDIPTSGTRTCRLGDYDTIEGELTINFTTGKVSGTIGPYIWGTTYPLTDATFKPSDAVSITAAYGEDAGNLFEAAFYGPDASDIAIRMTGEASGVLTGPCTAS
ncbi:hypothetical protein [Sphingomicrobium nitratireducens]|uniref:hypothetical protein n=1 Tax=Sphingomicrobium nitratireducens TaxID=2964666 RepID=UPI0022406620|nr:hypothetical protein [Sphingomicrobium nitratireducens]